MEPNKVLEQDIRLAISQWNRAQSVFSGTEDYIEEYEQVLEILTLFAAYKLVYGRPHPWEEETVDGFKFQVEARRRYLRGIVAEKDTQDDTTN